MIADTLQAGTSCCDLQEQLAHCRGLPWKTQAQQHWLPYQHVVDSSKASIKSTSRGSHVSNGLTILQFSVRGKHITVLEHAKSAPTGVRGTCPSSHADSRSMSEFGRHLNDVSHRMSVCPNLTACNPCTVNSMHLHPPICFNCLTESVQDLVQKSERLQTRRVSANNRDAMV